LPWPGPLITLEDVRRSSRLLLWAVAVLLGTGAPATASASHIGTCKITRKRPAGKKRSVFLERRVPAVRNNLPNIQALGALVVDLDSGEELFNRKADLPRAIASISKLAAALVLMDRNLVLDDLTTMKRVDLEVAKGGANSRLPEGMTLSNRDLLHAALLGSDNRAVAALGRAAGFTAPQFAEAMSKKAAELGLKHTHFRDPVGLSPENVSTPRETISMLRAAMANPTLGPILRRLEYDAHPLSRAPIKYVNTHRPAHRGTGEVLGGKTGYNDTARYCLVLAARLNGRRYGMAFLGTEGKLTRFGDVGRVEDWILARAPRVAPALARAPGSAVLEAPPAGDLTPPPALAAPDAAASPPLVVQPPVTGDRM
jgi:D-alanyl-D-alanine endopeptidase (penicillin-binding protein 7)